MKLVFGIAACGEGTLGAALVGRCPLVQLNKSFWEDQPPRGPLMGTTHNGNAKFYKQRFKYRGARRGGEEPGDWERQGGPGLAARAGRGQSWHRPLLISLPHSAPRLQSPSR